ncbi:MAG: 2-succinyl-5-enolpyruvyl-6-hydroxy-3-cyclohexene-1-carboxylic-acid synthase [Tannerellaceae bacterium]|nr:2-succinyl-5-enolpyruvyl-6-hydroxy-3-cyclohexene-1-carboxylic-acid synthase [Tannerellaceae bacterium]
MVALLKAFGIKHIVVSPGSRNSPLNHAFAVDEYFTCWPVTDERSAGFFATGIIQQSRKPVAVCCTSGSAVLNLAPAVSEAYYQPLPLLVLTADRPSAWIRQMDGQTLPQQNVFKNFIRKFVHLPEPATKVEEWYCNRLINEALNALGQKGGGPVHINIPLSEPLFQYTIQTLPEVRKINYYKPEVHFPDKNKQNSYFQRFRQYHKPMLVIGQQSPDKHQAKLLKELQQQTGCVILAEHLANIPDTGIGNFDPILYTLTDEDKRELAPDLVITIGGHVVSKRLKQLIREYSPAEHWLVTESGEVSDLFQCLTEVIEADAENFLSSLIDPETNTPEVKPAVDYKQHWESLSAKIAEPAPAFSDLYAVKELMKSIPAGSALHVGNSSSVRYSQLFTLPPNIQVYCNRGTSGIEGSVSAAVGYSAASRQLTFLLIGDLSFFYDMNGLWNKHISPNLRILINNNQGGKIFHALPGLNRSEALNPYIAGNHTTEAKGWVESCGFRYIKASNEKELRENMPIFTSPDSNQPIVLEVFSEIESNTEILRKYFHQIKQVVGS